MAKAQITLEGHGPQFDGVYELDIEAEPFTKREWHWIKEIAHVRPGEMIDAAQSGDTDLDVAFATIAVIRNGKAVKEQWRQVSEFFLDSMGTMKAEDVREDDAGPPDNSEIPTVTENISSEKPPSSFADTNSTGDDPQEIGLVSIGSPP